jgi:hypothetical protein
VPDFVLFMNEGIFVILKFIFIIMSECWFMPKKQLFIYIMARTTYKLMVYDDDDIRFVLHA